MTYIKLFLFLFLHFSLNAKTIHSIIVTDTIHTDVSAITAADLKNMQDEVRLAAKYSDSVLKERIFIGSEFNKDLVAKYVANLKVDSSDTVVFYFSGHGYRTYEKDTPWPYLSFDLFKVGLDMHWVAKTIWSKKPQFALILSDCCNNYAENGFNRESKNVYINLHKKNPKFSGYKNLFGNAKGCVMIASSSAGQYSYGSKYGGLYTYCFLVSLNKEICEPNPSWKSLLKRASGYIKHIQKPICYIYR